MKRKVIAAFAAMLAAAAMMWTYSGEPSVTADADGQTLSLVPCGNTIGIKIESDGVCVVGTSELSGPGDDSSKLIKGDIITKVGECEVKSTEELKSALESECGEKVIFEVIRDGKCVSVEVTPTVNPIDGSRLIGAWVRDSAAGIGTMTWYNPETGRYGALGHGITDIDTGSRYGIGQGEIVQVSVTGASKGEVGTPGLITGDFLDYEGTIDKNTEVGIGGYVENSWMLPGFEPIETAAPDEVREGNAEILCCIDGTGVERFSAEIEKTMSGRISGTKNLVLHITDDRIIEKTGGIVQGMSGSPIIQNGRLVGAVTHVFINDPTRGYGTFIKNML